MKQKPTKKATNKGETSYISIEGTHIVDKITYPDGKVEVIDRGHNLIVNSILPLIMCLLKKDPSYSGIQYWAVGSGASSWDTSLPSPTLTENKLTSELGRIAVSASNIKFVDDAYIETATPSKNIEVTVTFGENDCNGIWREFALFGGNATTSLNSGMMLNKKHHEVLTKVSGMIIERTIRLTISF